MVSLNTVQSFVKTCKKTAIPQLKPVKVNFEYLGYIRPNGNIVFSSNEQAINFAKNEVVSALKLKEPYEKAVVIKDNVIKGISRGKKDSVQLPVVNEKGCTVIHGHPATENGLTSPISVGDASTLIFQRDKYNKIVAYNSAGEYSQLSIMPTSNTPFFRELPEEFNYFKQLNSKSDIFQSKSDIKKKTIDSMTKEKIARLTTNIIGLEFKQFILRGSQRFQYFNAIHKGDHKLAQELLVKAQSSPKGIQRIHQYWRQNAAKYNLEYKTDYSWHV